MKNKDVNYYRKMLHKDSIVLLVVAIIFAIMSVMFVENGMESSVPMFLKSILFIIFLVIIICNKKENKTFIGILSIITGGLMMLTSIGDSSLFGIVYFLLGLFYVIHSIMYLVKYKNDSEFIENQMIQKKSKLVYLNLGLIIFSILSFFGICLTLGALQMIIALLGFASLLFVFVSSIVLMIKKYKGALLYITFIISIVYGFFFIAILNLLSRF